ncbi:MAG: FAD-dependent oxidoreductase [Pseudomonadota bacterium]
MARETMKADLCVIGAGAAGLTASAGAAQLGRSVVLFEAGEMGGDCLNTGCVPSKAILTAAHHVHAIRDGARMGVSAGEPHIDFSAVMAHVRRAITAIEPNDSQERFEGFGVKVIRERARFIGPNTVESDSVLVKAKRFVIAAGSRAAIPPVPGLAEAPYLTNETIWSLEALPEHLAILGGGPIGSELGQAFARLGAKVTIVEAERLLSRFEPEHAELVRAALKADGVEIIEGVRASRVDTVDGRPVLELEDGGQIKPSHLLVAAGRTPNVEHLNLEAAGVEADRAGIVCDDKLRTANRRVYAAGDIAGKGALTHLAGWHGSVIVRNLYFGMPTRQSSAAIPGAVYTDPPVAQVGLTETEAREEHGDKVRTAAWGFDDNDRALAEGADEGGAKLVIGPGAKLLGVHVAGDRADDIVQLATLAVQRGAKVRELTEAVAPYPTRGEVLKRAAGRYYEPVVFGPFARTWSRILTAFH